MNCSDDIKQKIIIPKGTIKCNEDAVIEIPYEYRDEPVVIVTDRSASCPKLCTTNPNILELAESNEMGTCPDKCSGRIMEKESENVSDTDGLMKSDQMQSDVESTDDNTNADNPEITQKYEMACYDKCCAKIIQQQDSDGIQYSTSRNQISPEQAAIFEPIQTSQNVSGLMQSNQMKSDDKPSSPQPSTKPSPLEPTTTDQRDLELTQTNQMAVNVKSKGARSPYCCKQTCQGPIIKPTQTSSTAPALDSNNIGVMRSNQMGTGYKQFIHYSQTTRTYSSSLDSDANQNNNDYTAPAEQSGSQTGPSSLGLMEANQMNSNTTQSHQFGYDTNPSGLVQMQSNQLGSNFSFESCIDQCNKGTMQSNQPSSETDMSNLEVMDSDHSMSITFDCDVARGCSLKTCELQIMARKQERMSELGGMPEMDPGNPCRAKCSSAFDQRKYLTDLNTTQSGQSGNDYSCGSCTAHCGKPFNQTEPGTSSNETTTNTEKID